MANQLLMAGAQSAKPTRYAPLWTGRFVSGLWTNRSPLRDATSSRVESRYIGEWNDSLITGLNTEISNKLTLIRRPGNSIFTINKTPLYPFVAPKSVDRFYDFRLFNPNSFQSSQGTVQNAEQIMLMIDQAVALSACNTAFQNETTPIWYKSSGAGQTYMQSVGNTLYFANGIDNKKWLQSLYTWQANQQLNTDTGQYPFLSTYFIDAGGFLQQLTATVILIGNTNVNGGIGTVTSSTSIAGIDLTTVLTAGQWITFPATMNASSIQGQRVKIVKVTSNTFTFDTAVANYSSTSEGINVYATVDLGDGSPVTGSSQPIWSLTSPYSGNNFVGGTTIDGTAQWTNRGNPVENWGIYNDTTPLTPTVVGGQSSWQNSTYYSLAGVIIDPNGNLQQVSTPGLSGANAPNWSTVLNGKTYDGSFPTGSPSTGVVWTMIASAGLLQWKANTSYIRGSFIVAQGSGTSVSPGTLSISSVGNSSSGSATYVVSSGGTANQWLGYQFVVAGFPEAQNNGTFYCVGSSASTLVLNNPSAVSETATAHATSPNTGPLFLYQSGVGGDPYIAGNVSAYAWAAPHSGGVGTWDGIDAYNTSNPANPPSGLPYGQTTAGSANAGQAGNLTSFDFAITGTGSTGPFVWNTVNASGQVTGTTNPFPGQGLNLYLSISATLEFPEAGNYVFSVSHGDGLVWGMGGGATLVSGTTPHNLAVAGSYTSLYGYPLFQAGNNLNVTANSGNQFVDTYTVNIPSAGTYPVEFCYARWDKANAGMSVTCNGKTLPFGQPTATASGTSGNTTPIWPAWNPSLAPGYASVTDGTVEWSNIGYISDFVWQPAENFNLPDTGIVDSNNNNQGPYRTGYTAATGGAPSWSKTLDALTDDNPNLIWINLGPFLNPPKGSLSTSNGGWIYGISLVNSLDLTVSNSTQVSAATGNFEDATSVNLSPGQGLPPLNQIDPQADYVAIWRSTDGQTTPFLVPAMVQNSDGTILSGSNIDYNAPVTLPLSVYIKSGFQDKTPDVNLNNLISAPINGENTPPPAGATNLAYYLNRLFYSVGNTVYWTTGPATPAGNGLNGTAPLNYDAQASIVSRIVPTTQGTLVFTVSDINLIQSTGNTSSPISPAVPLIPGVGLLSYNALDVNGGEIGFFTTDKQFLILDPSSGLSSVGFPLGDQFRLNNGKPGQTWNPANVYVTWHVNGEDQAWYVADGQYGWFRCMSAPAPEHGYVWSPFAQIVSGCQAVQSIEVTPGNHQLLLGPYGQGNILSRDLTNYQDGGQSYSANAVLGSIVLSQPGQIAVVPFITTESVGVGSPLVVGVLIDEALPYYKGPFNILKQWENDPPNLKPSISLPAQRFYLADDSDYAVAMRHMQIQVNWAAENSPNELLTITVFGGYNSEG